MLTLTGPAVEYSISTVATEFLTVYDWLVAHDVEVRIGLTLSSFWLEALSKTHTEFCLRYAVECELIDRVGPAVLI